MVRLDGAEGWRQSGGGGEADAAKVRVTADGDGPWVATDRKMRSSRILSSTNKFATEVGPISRLCCEIRGGEPTVLLRCFDWGTGSFSYQGVKKDDDLYQATSPAGGGGDGGTVYMVK